MFVPLLEVDFETDAVWGPGGGQISRDQDAEEKRVLKEEKGTMGYAWLKVRESVW